MHRIIVNIAFIKILQATQLFPNGKLVSLLDCKTRYHPFLGTVLSKWTSRKIPFGEIAPNQPTNKSRRLLPGDKVITFSTLNSQGLATVPYFFEFNDSNKKIVIRNMTAPEWSAKIQLPLFILTLTFTILGYAAFFYVRNSESG